MPKTDSVPPSITRTYRATIRHGEDFTVLEETITVPAGATPEQIAELVNTGWEIYRQQRTAVEEQMAEIRATTPPPAAPRIREPEAEASEQQRKLIDRIAFEDLGWGSDDLAEYAADTHGVTDFADLTKGQASAMIDALKKIKDEEKQHAAEQHAAERQQREQRPAANAPKGSPAINAPAAAANAPQGPGRRAPIAPAPTKLAQARATLAQAEQHAGVGTQGPVIREPNAPASDSQAQRIAREISGRNDRILKTFASDIAAALGEKTMTLTKIKELGTVQGVRQIGVTKGQATILIRLFLPREAAA